MSTFVVHKQCCNTTVLPHACQTSRTSDIQLRADLPIPNISTEQRKWTANPTRFSLPLPECFWEPSSQCRMKSYGILTSCMILIWSTVFPDSSVHLKRIVARGLRAVNSWAVLNASSSAKSLPPTCSLTSFHTSKYRFQGQVSLNCMFSHGTVTKNTWGTTQDGMYWYKCRLYILQHFISCHTDPTYLYSNWITGMTTYLKNMMTMLLGRFSIWNYCFKDY